MYDGGDMICSFLTNDKFYKNISNVGKKLTPYSIAICGENIYFLTPHFKFFKREKNKDIELLKTKEISVDPFDYHVSICGKFSFKNYENINFIQFMITLRKPKPTKLFGGSVPENNVEKYIHAFMHLCLVRV